MKCVKLKKDGAARTNLGPVKDGGLLSNSKFSKGRHNHYAIGVRFFAFAFEKEGHVNLPKAGYS